MFRTGSWTSVERIGCPGIEPQHVRLGLLTIAVVLMGAGGLLFDALTPRAVTATVFYVGLVLAGFWLPHPKAALALALLATPLVIIGYWLSPPDPAPAWEAWINRGLSVCIVWLAAVFVWRFRVLEQKLQRQIDIAIGLSVESRLLASIVESSDDAIISKNLDGIITSWNRSAERLFRYLAEEVIGKPVTIIIPAERHHEEDMILGHIRRGEHVDHYETVRRRKDGTLIDISLTVSPIRGEEGRFVGASKIVRDITERKKMDAQLRESRDQFRRLASIVESSDDAIISKNLDGIITSWNNSAERLFGYVPGEVIGKPVMLIIPPERHHEEAMMLGRIRRGVRVEHYETVGRRKDGSVIDISLTVSPVRGAEGTVVAASMSARDITERKHAEEELRKSEERFRSSVVQSPVPTILFDDREQILAISRSWLTAAGGVSAAELHRLEDWTKRAYGERSDKVLELIRGIIATEPEGRPDEMTILTRSGDKRIWNFVTSGLGTKSDGRRLFVSVAQDVTDRRAYEEQIHFLMREARHRTKNILGLVQAIARQTATRDAPDFIGRFTERIQALAANQDILVRHEWQRIDVRDLVKIQLGHFADLIGTRVNFDGPKLYLNAAAAQAIGLALHELATNAGKYGALSTDTGRVDISWRRDNDTFTMSWTEREGPPVSAPTRRGFGTIVMEAMAERSVEGRVDLNYPPSGLVWRLACPAANALEPTGQGEIKPSSMASYGPVPQRSPSAGDNSAPIETGRR
jgi:PAS domain S-box-containing protein